MRQWILGVALVILFVFVWWDQVYSPLRAEQAELAVDLFQGDQERDRLRQRIERLFHTPQNQKKMEETMASLQRFVVPGNSLEDISANIQIWVQKFLESHDLSLLTYRGLPSSKWREYSVSRVRFQLNASTQGFSDLLERLENMEKAIRIESLGVEYRRSREKDLRVSLDLGAVAGFAQK